MDEHLADDTKELCDELIKLSVKIEALKKEMHGLGANVSTTLEKYQKGMKNFDVICDDIMNHMKRLSYDENHVGIEKSEEHRQHIKQQYCMDNLKNLPSEENINSIDIILEDIAFRAQCLSSYLKKLALLLQTKSSEVSNSSKTSSIIEHLGSPKTSSSDFTSIIEHLKKATKRQMVMEESEQLLKSLREHYQSLEQFTDKYCSLLVDKTMQDTPNSRFILLVERLRTKTEKLETNSFFAATNQLMYEWQKDHGADDNFTPKIIDLCKTIEIDINDLFTNKNYLYSVPYKIGIIGDAIAGKSALTIALSGMEDTAGTILFQRSTYGYLQIDTFSAYQNNKVIPFTFIDIEGATDSNFERSITNYIDTIMKTDCDLYIIVFDRPFTDFNQRCLDYIENTLKRKCLLVRSKVDILFKQIYNDHIKRPYHQEDCVDFELNTILKKIRNHALVNSRDDKMEREVFLLAAGQNNDLKETKFGQFDLKNLKKQLFKSSLEDCRIERICKLAILTSKAIINTCFRRGYVVSSTKYAAAAAVTSILPFVDEISAFFGREKIRQAFGIHDSFAMTNAICNTKDSLEEYLMKQQFTIPKDELKSGYFQYLVSTGQYSSAVTRGFEFSQSVEITATYDGKDKLSKSSKKRSRCRIQVHKIAPGSATFLGVTGQLTGDVLRVAIPGAAGALRVVSIAGIVVGVVLTPLFAAWAFFNAGNKMNQHLHLLCDDLQIVLTHFIINLCNRYCENIPLPYPISRVEETSSEEED